MYGLIKKIVCCPGVSGREKNIADVIRGEIAPYVDEIKTDTLGNLIALKRGSAPDECRKKVLYCAHMDEIGFLVTFIEESGLVRVAPVGGIDYTAAAYSEVVFENGVRGVIVPDRDARADSFSADKFGIDIGASSAADARRRVAVGDTCAVLQHVSKLGAHRLSGRPLDDRVCCAMLIAIAKQLPADIRDDIYFVFSVQEEVGCRGARTAGFAVAPDYALAFDVCGTGDTAGCKPMAVKLGGGAAIKIKDSSVICSTLVVDKLRKLAEENGTAAQSEILISGGTDTSSLQLAGAGCHAGAISVPCRYIHTPVETVDMRDIEAGVELGAAFAAAVK